jgi:hypothetical protein
MFPPYDGITNRAMPLRSIPLSKSKRTISLLPPAIAASNSRDVEL